MPLFQNTVITKYLKTQNESTITEKWQAYKTHFLNPTIQENIRNSKEEQYQAGYLRDLFVNILGYTLNPDPNFNLTTELKNVKDAKKADGGILINNKVFGVIELKGTNTTDLAKVETQAFGYKNNQPECVYVITSNFEKLRFYIDNAIEHIEFNLFTLTEKDFKLLYLCIALENIKNHIPKKLKDESLSQEELITKQLYKDYSLFKRELFQDLTKQNPQFEALELFKKSQKLLDRFLFLFFAEDRNLLPPNSVRLILKQWKQLKELDAYDPLYNRFKKYFGYLNTGFKGKQYDVFAYNGGLFKPDTILDTIQIDDDLLYKHTLKLADYDFESEVDVNILGHIFENSLNELDEVKAQLEGQEIDKTNTKRKKDGVFYTPKYITKYIVENTVGKLCTQQKEALAIVEDQYTTDKKRTKATKKPLLDKLTTYRNWLLQLTICDPACGSGAFLNEALNFLIAEHSYVDELQAKLFGDALLLSDVENSILENNLFGVDLNEESVEIAKLSLWLRTAQPNRKLNSLNNNIKCGNSLIDDVAVAGDKAFNWEQEFPTIFKEKHKKAYHITTAIHDSRTSARMVKYKVRERREMGTNPYPNVIYFTPEDDLLITKTIANIVKEEKLNLLAYNICADHLHLLLVCDIDEIPAIMQKIKGRTSYENGIKNRFISLEEEKSNGDYKGFYKGFNKGFKPLVEKEKNNKPLWQQKYSPPKEVTTKEQLDNTLNYIQNNRQKHELPAHSKALQTIINTMCCSPSKGFKEEYTGGFDVIIGNPPYVQVNQTIFSKFETQKCSDLYAYFFEKSMKLIKPNGLLSFITPSSYFTNLGYLSLREYLLNYNIIQLLDLGENVFADASVDSGILVVENEITKDNKVKCSDNSFNFSLINKSVFNSLDNKIFNIYLNPKSLKIANKILSSSILFKEIIDFSRGVEFGFKSKNVTEIKKDNTFPILCGGNINRYKINFENKFVNYDENAINIYKKKDIYIKQKILVRRIGNSIISCFDDLKYFNVCDVYNLQLKANVNDFSLKYISVILNSQMMNFYFDTKFKSVKKLFPKIPIQNLKLLPIKKSSLSEQQPFIEKADQMLSLNKELQEASSKFQRTLQRKFEGLEKLPKKLENWYELTFADFVKELKKKKIKLSLAEEAEWEDYFLTQQQKAVAIKNQINTTDKQIDAMVYKLYNLTEEEIAIVEAL